MTVFRLCLPQTNIWCIHNINIFTKEIAYFHLIQTPDLENTSSKKRADLLTVLCILSFVGSGLAAFSNLVLLLTYDELGPVLEEMNFNAEEFKLILSGGKSFFISGFFLYLISFFGVYSMWRLKKIGFHLYTASQVFLILLPIVSIPEFPFSFPGLLITIAFIFGYFTQLKQMN